jgi:hypothetical protein
MFQFPERERERETERERDRERERVMLGVVAKEVNRRDIFLVTSRLFKKLLILQNKIHKACVPSNS